MPTPLEGVIATLVNDTPTLINRINKGLTMKFFTTTLGMLLSLLITSKAIAQQVNGSMDCKVTGNVVISSEEGKSKRYSSIKDGSKEGDKLTFKYTIRNSGLFLSLENEFTKHIELNTIFDFKDGKLERPKSRGLIYTGTYNEVTFSEDYIRLENSFGKIFLSRYYKNDWHGIYLMISAMELTTQTMTINCRHNNDQMESGYKIYSRKL
ncbi:MAG: hypothetical protein B7Y59_10025 [Burkholderiales bacterium 35-55-47]|jgi:hypothetical protein|uniref:hypothetical protein n=1 Tax=Limnohabitans sp. TaxID=1907725 RepID=UPI000BC43A5F|nr:hypothetical protein [Limnohabitans sp.]OYY17967.1 MAG: hypothetical protein B7Y59_10025 [Burkholderiales bacterium 35-55-47]OYZ73494.1 MAG: hypothetical protein B7Y06_05520 [Burkholderiales bacterium 24-55-52]OZB00640.1 MAG: hypothetical protein B7X62_05535 [Burkholderiales bacterium 39-55-53]HQR85615.1 hypothetical protein [Limnohabitans sp.]HQS26468.1 hypothetical protein [Limnohabitans sp.]